MVEQHFCLRWNNYRTNITAEFEVLREGEHFVDVTLACDGQQLKAHKVVLSACSPYFKDLLQGNPCSHPIIILRDVGYVHMRGLLEFMYAGEVNVSQAQLAAFLRTAEALKVRGLAEAPAPQQQQQPSSVHQVAAAAAAAAAVTNSVVDLLALNSSIGSLPLVPLSSHMPLGGVSHASALDSKQSNSSYSRPPAGLSCSAESHSKCEDDQVESEPLPLTVNSETKVKERCSPPPPSLRCSKRVKYSGSREGSPESPSHSSYYPTNTPSNGSAATVGPESHDDADGGELVHDLSSNSRKRQLSGPHKDSSRNVSSNANGGDSNSGGTHGGASRPPSLAPSPPQHLQYVFKNEPADPCGGSDTEGGCGGGWLEDNSVGSDGEMLVGGHDPSGGSTVGDHGKNGGSVSSSLMLPSLHPSASGAGPPSSSRGHPLQHSSSSPPLPLQQQPQQQQHVLHRAMPPQESHLAGLGADGSDRGGGGGGYSMEEYPRGDGRCDRTMTTSGGLVDPMDPSRCDLRSGSPPLPPSSLPHECQVCGKLISCRRNLWKHMERVHLTNPAVRCSICAKLFKNKYALKDHQRIYHGGLSEPLPSSPLPHHQSSANLLSRILRDARPCPPPGPVSLSRPSCSIISVSPSSSLDVGRPPRELAPLPHPAMENLPSYHRRLREDDDQGGSVMYGAAEGGPSRLPPPPPLPPVTSMHMTSPSMAPRRGDDVHGNSSMLRPS